MPDSVSGSVRIRIAPADLLSPDALLELLQQAATSITDRRRAGTVGMRRALTAGATATPCDDDPDCKFIEQLPNGWLLYDCNGEVVMYPDEA